MSVFTGPVHQIRRLLHAKKKGNSQCDGGSDERNHSKASKWCDKKQLSEEYGMLFKTIKAMIWRENRNLRQQAEGLRPTKTRGRKPAVTLAEYKYENKRLKMENELLRDFLSLVGRK